MEDRDLKPGTCNQCLMINDDNDDDDDDDDDDVGGGDGAGDK